MGRDNKGKLRRKETVPPKQVIADINGEGKRCPFYMNAMHRVAKCIQGECMFWSEEAQDCNINVLARKL